MCRRSQFKRNTAEADETTGRKQNDIGQDKAPDNHKIHQEAYGDAKQIDIRH